MAEDISTSTKLKMAKGVNKVSFSAEKTGKEKIPEGAKVLKDDISVNVEQIENGFLICKTHDIKYQEPGNNGNSGYAYYTEKWYSEDNPLSIDTENKELADVFE